MSGNDWKRELQRLLELFEYESAISLKVIKRCFDTSGLPFDEKFRKYFMKMSIHRLDAGFDTVLFDQCDENRMPMVQNANASIDNNAPDKGHDDTPNVAENETMAQLKMENDADDPIEIADTDDEGGEQGQMQIMHDPIEDEEMEANVMQISNNGVENRDGECNGSANVNDENVIASNVKNEVKIETEIEMKDLPMVEFDPNKANDEISVQNNIAEAETLNGKRQSSSTLNIQRQLKHDVGKRFKCTECAFTSHNKFNFKQHLLIHKNIKPFKCTHCDYACRRKAHLKRHQKVHVQGKLMGVVRDPNDESYKCTHCEQRFLEMRHLSMHLTQSHKNNQRLFNCVHCLRRFVRKAEKDKHEIRCENRRYECYLCKRYATSNVGAMQRHMRTHSGAKPFECAICKKCFWQRGNLRRHLDLHGCKS